MTESLPYNPTPPSLWRPYALFTPSLEFCCDRDGLLELITRALFNTAVTVTCDFEPQKKSNV